MNCMQPVEVIQPQLVVCFLPFNIFIFEVEPTETLPAVFGAPIISLLSKNKDFKIIFRTYQVNK